MKRRQQLYFPCVEKTSSVNTPREIMTKPSSAACSQLSMANSRLRFSLDQLRYDRPQAVIQTGRNSQNSKRIEDNYALPQSFTSRNSLTMQSEERKHLLERQQLGKSAMFRRTRTNSLQQSQSHMKSLGLLKNATTQIKKVKVFQQERVVQSAASKYRPKQKSNQISSRQKNQKSNLNLVSNYTTNIITRKIQTQQNSRNHTHNTNPSVQSMVKDDDAPLMASPRNSSNFKDFKVTDCKQQPQSARFSSEQCPTLHSYRVSSYPSPDHEIKPIQKHQSMRAITISDVFERYERHKSSIKQKRQIHIKEHMKENHDGEYLREKIQQIKQTLERVCSEDDKHQIIRPEKTHKVFLNTDEMVTFKITCYGEASPCIISVQDSQNFLKHELKAFVSQRDPRPNKDTNSGKYRNTNQITVFQEQGGKSFQQDYIFVSFVSTLETTINIRVLFLKKNSINDPKKKQKQTVTQKQKLLHVMNHQDEIQNQVRQIKAIRRQQRHGKNFIVHNMESPKNEQPSNQWEDRKQSVERKRQGITQYEERKNLAQAMKWQIIRQKRQELITEQKVVILKKKFAFDWLASIQSYQVMKFYLFALHQIAEVRKGKLKLVMFVEKVKWVFKHKFLRFGKTLQLRDRNRIRQSLCLFHKVLKIDKVKQSQNLLLQFLFKTALIESINSKVSSCIDKIHFFQRVFKKHISSINLRKTTVKNQIWRNLIQQMSAYFITYQKKFPQPHLKDIGVKINFLEETLKIRIVDLFMNRQITYHSIRFLQWQKVNKGRKDLTEVIYTRLEQLYEMDQIMFMEYEIPKFDSDIFKKKKDKTDKHQSVEEWNCLERISSLMIPRQVPHCMVTGVKTHHEYKLKVPHSHFHYVVTINDYLPSFQFIPQSIEIFQRLVLRVALAFSVHDFTLKKSHF